jgi:hypothetical protein
MDATLVASGRLASGGLVEGKSRSVACSAELCSAGRVGAPAPTWAVRLGQRNDVNLYQDILG